MTDDTVPTWIFPIVFFGFLTGIFLLYWWLDHGRKK